MKKTFWLALILLLAGFSVTGTSQVLNPVTWDYFVEETSENEATLVFKASIQENWHVYSTNLPENGPVPTKFNYETNDSFELSGPIQEVSEGISEFDEIFKIDVLFYGNEAIFKQKIKINSDKRFSINGSIEYQACDDEQCIFLDEDFSFTINKNQETTSESIAGNDPAQIKEKVDPRAPTDLRNKSLITLFFIAFLSGLIALLTPCVFPMIPMTVSFFMKDTKSKARSLRNAFVFGFSIIAIYTIIGTIVAVLFGAGFANWLSTHWIPNVLFFLIFIVFAASFFGMFEITLPSWMINKADKNADKGGFTGAFFMAFTLVLVSFSCTGPIVGAILVESAGGNVIQPVIGMLGFSLAFALPFTLFAIFPSWLSSLPKSGGWLNSVKVVLGFIELALGLKFLSIADQTYHWGILDREIYLAIWIVIFTLMGFYLLGKIKFAHDSELKFLGVPRLMLVIVTFSFVVYMIPGMFGAPLKGISGYLPPQTTHDFDIHEIIRENIEMASFDTENKNELCEKPKYGDKLHLPHGLEGYFDYEQGLACAKEQNKPIFIDFTGHGCVNCREMESRVWSAPKVLEKLKNDFVIIALYVDDKQKLPEEDWIKSEVDGKIKKTLGKKYADFQISRFNTNSQPYYVLLDTQGEMLTDPQAYDLDEEVFLEFLDKGLTEFDKRSTKPNLLEVF